MSTTPDPLDQPTEPPTESNEPNQRPTWQQWPILAGVGVAVLALIAAAIIITRPGDQLPTIESAPAAEALDQEEVEIAAAKKRFIAYLALRDRLYEDPTASMDPVKEYAIGREIDVMGGTLHAFRNHGTSFRGQAELRRLAIVSARLDSNTPTIQFETCLVPPQELKQGVPFKAEGGYYGPSLMDITMRRVDGVWFVENTFLGKEALRPC